MGEDPVIFVMVFLGNLVTVSRFSLVLKINLRFVKLGVGVDRTTFHICPVAPGIGYRPGNCVFVDARAFHWLGDLFPQRSLPPVRVVRPRRRA